MDKLNEQLTAKLAEIDALLKSAEDEERPLTEEEQGKLKTMEDERDALKAKIDGLNAVRLAKGRQQDTRDWLKTPAGRITSPTKPQLGDDGAKFEVPAFLRRAARVGKLRSFQGPDALEQAYAAGQFFLASIWGKRDALKWCETHLEGLTLGEGTDTKGGFLVPDFLANTIVDLREQYGVFRRNVRTVAMPTDVYRFPRRTGGLTAYWVGENSEVTASDKGWDAISLTARKLAALCKYSTEIAEDAIISIADDLAREIAYAFAVREDQCGFLGTGAQATYGGISGLITQCAAATATVVTAATGNTTFATLDLADFEAMIGKLPMFPGISPKWYISKPGWAASMMRLADAAGGITYGEVLNGARTMQFLGYPVEFVPCMNSTLTAQTSTNGICYFGDLSMAATMGERRGLSVKSTTERYFEYDQIGIMGTERVDINVHDVGDTTSAGAMIMMATPSG